MNYRNNLYALLINTSDRVRVLENKLTSEEYDLINKYFEKGWLFLSVTLKSNKVSIKLIKYDKCGFVTETLQYLNG